MDTLEKIIKTQLCLGCGICQALGKEYNYQVELTKSGFYCLRLPTERNLMTEKNILSVCPGINLVNENNKTPWGTHLEAYNAWAKDETIRYRGSSGGVITALCCYLLEQKTVDGILQIGKSKNHVLFNELHISKTRDEVISNSASRYAPAKGFSNILHILESSTETYCLVGKPCDIAAIKRLITLYPAYKERIKYFISIFCAGMPSYNATLKLLAQNHPGGILPETLRYRGNGWPGTFKAEYADKTSIEISYHDSWGKTLGRNLLFRCKICPDGIGLSADIAIGDAWRTTNGYPDFSDRPGESFVLIRTAKGSELLKQACHNNVVECIELNVERLAEMQPVQYQRRLLAGYRIYALKWSRMIPFHFLGGSFFPLMRKISLNKGIRNGLGTIIRYIKLPKKTPAFNDIDNFSDRLT